MDLINVLIRTGDRPEQFMECYKSIKRQTYKKIRIIASDDCGCDYIPDDVEVIRVQKGVPYSWNLYCNILKQKVTEGWFFFLDDDDKLDNERTIEEAAKYLNYPNEPVIFQMIRDGRRIPEDVYMNERVIHRGHIGMPCIFIHHTKKDLVDFDGKKAADYRFIKALSEKLNIKFIKHTVVKVPRESRGKGEITLHRICPDRKDKNLGRAYNEEMRLIPDEDWVCFTDNDVLFLTPDAFDIIREYIKRFPRAALFTCYTNRIGAEVQLLDGKFNEDGDIKNHILIAEERKKHLYQISYINTMISGFLMVMSKKIWKKYMFDETGEALGVDNRFSKRLLRANETMIRMEGLYVFHIYRLMNGKDYKDHLI